MMMDKVEKAVIALNGEWPTWATQKEKGGYYEVTGGVLGKDMGVAPTMYVCTRPEFMEARKRLENKPGWDEHEYDFVAQCRDGMWVGFYDGVLIEPANHVWHQGVYGGHTIQQGRAFSDWHQSLEPRPQPDNKEGDWCVVGAYVQVKHYPIHKWKVKEVTNDNGVRIQCDTTSTWVCRTEIEPYGTEEPEAPDTDVKKGEGVEWDGEGIAPVGINARCARYANPVKVLFSTNQVAVVESDWGEQRALDPELVLPLKSHRDKVIEAAMAVGGLRGRDGCKEVYGRLYDHGLLKLPGEEE